eukprot:1937533-Rhodomonas_salina.1
MSRPQPQPTARRLARSRCCSRSTWGVDCSRTPIPDRHPADSWKPRALSTCQSSRRDHTAGPPAQGLQFPHRPRPAR